MSVIEVQSGPKVVVEDQSEGDSRYGAVINAAAVSPEKGILWSVNFNKLELVL